MHDQICIVFTVFRSSHLGEQSLLMMMVMMMMLIKMMSFLYIALHQNNVLGTLIFKVHSTLRRYIFWHLISQSCGITIYTVYFRQSTGTLVTWAICHIIFIITILRLSITRHVIENSDVIFPLCNIKWLLTCVAKLHSWVGKMSWAGSTLIMVVLGRSCQLLQGFNGMVILNNGTVILNNDMVILNNGMVILNKEI